MKKEARKFESHIDTGVNYEENKEMTVKDSFLMSERMKGLSVQKIISGYFFDGVVDAALVLVN